MNKKIILRILRNANPKLQTAVLVTSSGGLKIGELVQLKLSDIDFNSNPTKILVRGTSKRKISHETFITSEATNSLKDYLQKNFGWHKNSLNLDLQGTYIFARTSKRVKDDIPRFNAFSARESLQSSLVNHIKNIPELSIKNKNGRRTVHFHSFRKHFRTIVGHVCGLDYAEALTGNGIYMDAFYQLSSEEKIKKYLDAEPYLTISDFEKAEQRFTDLSDKYTELEKSMTDLKRYLISNSISILESLR